MHFILEGVLPRHCKFVLVHCLFEERYVTLKMVNRLISEFEYGYSESRNVPRQLDNDHLKSSESKLSQSGMYDCYVQCHTYNKRRLEFVEKRDICSIHLCTYELMSTNIAASQMWLLGRLLPLIMGKYVPDDDAHWRCYIQLLRILTISTATEVTEDTVSTISFLI